MADSALPRIGRITAGTARSAAPGAARTGSFAVAGDIRIALPNGAIGHRAAIAGAAWPEAGPAH